MPSLTPRGAPHLVGGYAFDEPTLRSLIADWTELAESYRSSRRNARAMGQVVGPGNDPASLSYAEAANRSAASYLDYLTHNEQFCRDQAQRCQDALSEYLAAEDASAALIKAAGSDNPRSAS